MKNVSSIGLCFVLVALLCGCKKAPSDSPKPASAATIAVDPNLQPPNVENETKVGTHGNALVATQLSEAPPCDVQSKGHLVYTLSDKKFLVCDGSNWSDIALKGDAGKDGKDGNDGADGSKAKLLTRESEESSGANCRYSGKKVETGIDTNANATLEEAEVGSRVYVCEGNIETVGKKIFAKYFQSVGIVVATYSHPLGCKTSSAGTGWIAGESLAVTNQHVVEQKANFSCYGVPLDGSLSKVSVFFPKTTFAADSVLRQGLPHYAGFSPSLEDFDEVPVAKIDRAPTTSTTDKADLAFLEIGKTTRTPLVMNMEAPSSDSPNTLRTGDEIVAIGYSVVQGPRLTVGRVFHIENCEALVRAMAGPNYKPSDCLSQLKVTEKTLMMSYWGYGDHGGSGSPVLDRFGNVVGVHTWGAGEGQAPFNAAQMASDVNRFLKLTRSFKELSAP